MPERNAPERRATAPKGGQVLIVGATRILRPAVATLSERAGSVTAVARSAADLGDLAAAYPGRVTPLAADATAHDFDAVLRAAAERAPLTGAVVYAPAVAPGTLAALVGAVVAGPVVVIATSKWAAPAASGTDTDAWTPDDLPAAARSEAPSRRLVLGWRGTGEAARWHTPPEISAAALALLDAPADRDAVLGTVRPWSSRPK